MEQSFKNVSLVYMARLKEFDPDEKLEEARNLFWKKGYQATSMQDLVNDMKINRGSLYDTYGDKRKLFIDSIRHYVLETHAAYNAVIRSESSPIRSIEKIIHLAVKRSFEESKVCMVVKSSFEMAHLDNDIKKVLKESTAALTTIFKDLLQSAHDQGTFEKNRDIEATANFIVASFAGFWQMQALYNDKKMVDQMAECLVDYLK